MVHYYGTSLAQYQVKVVRIRAQHSLITHLYMYIQENLRFTQWVVLERCKCQREFKTYDTSLGHLGPILCPVIYWHDGMANLLGDIRTCHTSYLMTCFYV